MKSTLKTITYDAQGQVLGRLASKIAHELMDKNNPGFVKHIAAPKKILVRNAKAIVVTGTKSSTKVYHHHSGFLGGLKTEKFGDIVAKDPGEVLRRAISSMIPRNRLHSVRMNMLDIKND